MTENTNYSNQEDEITLKELILKIKGFWSEIVKFWFWILLLGAVIGLYMGYTAFKTKPQYKAELTFMLNDNDGGGGMPGLGGLLGTFGLGGGGGSVNLDKIVELSKTRKIAKKLLFKKCIINNKNDFIANHLIDYKVELNEWANKPFYDFWSAESKIKNFKFKSDSINSFDRTNNSILKSVHSLLIGNANNTGLIRTKYVEETGIMSISAVTGSEELSYYLCDNQYAILSEYYVSKTIEKQKYTFDLLSEKSDSIQIALRNAQYSLASYKDKNQNMYTSKDNLNELRLTQEVQKLGAMYAEVSKNLEIASFSLKSKTPFMQEIDEPLLPLRPAKPSLFRSLIIGGFLGVFLSIGIIVIRKVYRDTME